MTMTAERLFDLLPPVYRLRDHQQGGPLRALLQVIAEQVRVVEDDLDQLYDDHFVETCAEWAIPYVGELVGARLLTPAVPGQGAGRADVADTLRLRRRKGTAAVLEQLARDVAGWDAAVVEFFDRVATTQSLHHLRPHAATPDLRRWEPLERLGTPFGRLPHTANVRAIRGLRGAHNLPNVGVYLYRLRAFPVLTATARDRGDQRRFHFSPLGNDAPLFTFPQPEPDVTHLAGPLNVPLRITRRVLERYTTSYAGSSFRIWENGAEVDTARIRVCDLSAWGLPAPWPSVPQGFVVLMDPVLGRLAFRGLAAGATREVRVTWHQGFGGELGGGSYDRSATFGPPAPGAVHLSRGGSLATALQSVGTAGTLEVMDSATYPGPAAADLTVTVAAGAEVHVRAVDRHRPLWAMDGELVLSGPTAGTPDPAEVTLDGVMISGGTLVIRGAIGKVTIRHCTLVPGRALKEDGSAALPGAVSLRIETPDAAVVVERSVLGGIRAVEGASVRLVDSVVDAGSSSAVAYAAMNSTAAGGPLQVEASTVVGRVRCAGLEASDSLFLARAGAGWTAPVESSRLQEGCVRFSFVPVAARVPRRHRCAPTAAADEARTTPLFASLRYGDPDYGLLHPATAREVRTGASDGGEMGAFHHVNQPRREANLRIRLDEYLRFGMEAGIFIRT
jgi:hypothetical protein